MTDPIAPAPNDRLPGKDLLLGLFRSAPFGIYLGTLDDGGGEAAAVNPALRSMVGYGQDEVAAPLAPDRFADRPARDALLDRLRRDGGVRDLLVRLRRMDGTLIWVELSGTGEHRAGSACLQVALVLRDVTERRRLDEQTRDLHQQLLQAEKLAALGQTISGVAHELNNPLATILTSSERLVGHVADAALRRSLETIRSEAERAAKIVRNLLAFARKRHTTRTMVDLNQVVRDTLALRDYEHRLANIAVIDALAAGLPPVFADPHQLQQVLLNLVINAEQAMISTHGRGSMVVRSWHEADRDLVVFELNDDGPGVPAQAVPRIFDPFFTTKHAGEGTGLGLTVASAIVEEHGGRLRVQSGEGTGASFFVELPTASVSDRPRATAPEPLPRDVGGGARVLLVDDEPRLAAAVAEALTDAGFEVEQAHDGRAALELTHAGDFDLVICDLRMPNLDGPAFYRAIAASKPSLARRVVFVTGDVAGTDAGRFLEESGCRWLTKPFRLADLLRTARDVLG